MRRILAVLLVFLLLPCAESQAALGFGSMGHATENDGIWSTDANFTLAPPYTIQFATQKESASGKSVLAINTAFSQCWANETSDALEVHDNWSSTRMGFVAHWSTTSGMWSWPFPQSSWRHVVIRYTGASTTTKPVVWVNGSAVTVTTDTTPVGSSISITGTVNVGSCYQGSGVYSGKISRVAIWNVELTDNEVSALYNGVSPINVRHDSLVFYVPLQRYQDGQPDWSPLRTPMTMSGTAAVADDIRQGVQ